MSEGCLQNYWIKQHLLEQENMKFIIHRPDVIYALDVTKYSVITKSTECSLFIVQLYT